MFNNINKVMLTAQKIRLDILNNILQVRAKLR